MDCPDCLFIAPNAVVGNNRELVKRICNDERWQLNNNNLFKLLYAYCHFILCERHTSEDSRAGTEGIGSILLVTCVSIYVSTWTAKRVYWISTPEDCVRLQIGFVKREDGMSHSNGLGLHLSSSHNEALHRTRTCGDARVKHSALPKSDFVVEQGKVKHMCVVIYASLVCNNHISSPPPPAVGRWW